VAPLNRAGDQSPSSWHDGVVTTTAGFKEAFKAFGELGLTWLTTSAGDDMVFLLTADQLRM